MTSSARKLDSTRTIARSFLVAVELFVAVGALYGGIGLIADNAIGMLPEWLDGTPFSDWTLPGVFLLVIVATPMLIAAIAELRRFRWAYAASLVAGAAILGWILAQLLIIGRYFFLQPIMFGCGVVVIALAWAVHRGEPILPTRLGIDGH